MLGCNRFSTVSINPHKDFPTNPCTMPEANEVMVGMMALIAQHEVKAVSQ